MSLSDQWRLWNSSHTRHTRLVSYDSRQGALADAFHEASLLGHNVNWARTSNFIIAWQTLSDFYWWNPIAAEKQQRAVWRTLTFTKLESLRGSFWTLYQNLEVVSYGWTKSTLQGSSAVCTVSWSWQIRGSIHPKIGISFSLSLLPQMALWVDQKNSNWDNADSNRSSHRPCVKSSSSLALRNIDLFA